MKVVLEKSVLGKLCLGVIVLEGVEAGDAPRELDEEMRRLAEQMGAKFQGLKPSEIPGLSVARRLYRAMGMDPTRVRPSSEALLRRSIKGRPLYRVNSVVDAGNLFSLESLLPIGLYDAEKIHGDVLVRLGTEADGYEGIRKGRIGLRGRIGLFDDEGPFGNPSADSLRTSIGPDTRSILLVIFVPAGYGKASLDRAVTRAAELQVRYNGGQIVQQEIVAS